LKRLSQRELRRLQSRAIGSLGLDVRELGRADVSIRLPEREIILRDTSVVALGVEKEKVYQLVGGEVEERPVSYGPQQAGQFEPSEEDVMLVMAQAEVSDEQARRALRETSGDLAKAILLLKTGH